MCRTTSTPSPPRDGDIFAYPTQSGVNVFIGIPMRQTLDAIGYENFEPGDIWITNDPFSSDGLSRT